MPRGELELRAPPNLARVTVHAKAGGRRGLILAAFLVLHSVTFKFCIDTSGDAHKVAVAKARRLAREHVENGTKPEDIPPQDELPTEWAPNSWAGASLFGSLSLHALFYLMCLWKVSFRAKMLFVPAKGVSEDNYVQVTPLAHRGRAEIAPLELSDASVRLVFTFQRQHYEYWEPENDEEEFGEIKLVSCPIDKPISSYLDATGLRKDQVAELSAQYGDNLLEVAMPSFLQCYKEQLVTPLVIFQVFVALLWAADDFVQYTLMQIVFILVFESTSVFQRLKTMKMLNSMGTKSYLVKVFRDKEWIDVSTSELLPGDFLELVVGPTPQPAEPGAKPLDTDKVALDIVPCDCVIIRGEAIASEASLTGESAPQMKDALFREDRGLDLQGADRVHSLFSGTRLLRASEGQRGVAAQETGSAAQQVPWTPEGGCLCYVVRTGFASSQGELLQMIEFSQEKVSGDTKEILVALLILVAFALVSAGYVLKTGLEKGEKTPHELLIKCVIILTAVVPRQLPMQMAVAVNTALMSLIKNGVYCTEPFRVPLAGKLTHCLFDKTGTLTTDILVPCGVVNSGGAPCPKLGYPAKAVVCDASPASAIVLAACHSLVSIDGRLSGDPIEVAALEGVGWSYDAEKEVATPKPPYVAPAGDEAAAVEDAKPEEGAQTDDDQTKTAPQTEGAKGDHAVESVKILQRFHFSSKMQRMAVVAEVSLGSGADALDGPGRYALVKGSPEAISSLLAEGAEPSWFHCAHLSLAESGLRVLALAYRRLKPEESQGDNNGLLKREAVECQLSFGGFIAFECKVRADSSIVIGALRESDHVVAMLTGDAPLTALHVARTCGIVDGKLDGLLLTALPAADEGGEVVEWVVATGPRRGEKRPFSTEVSELYMEFALMTTGEALDAAVAAQPSFWTGVDQIHVFARMSPQGKAAVINELQNQGQHVLMCGDGGNDVGALKQADVGLALLAGYGNVNTSETLAIVGAPGDDEAPENAGVLATIPHKDEGKGAETILNEHQKALQKRTKDAGKARQKFLWERQKALNTNHQTWLEEEVNLRAENGQTGMMAQAGSVKVVLARYTAELKKEMKEYDLKHGNVYDVNDKGEVKEGEGSAMDKMKKQMEDTQSQAGLPMVRPGDASIAAPFTSKAPSVKNCVDLIRQGRCTLLSALQQQQIMMLNCIINAYVLSALSLEGSRSSERQMMASHWLLTTAFLAFGYASPCDRMHPVRPLRSLFHPAVFVSMLGQAAIHLVCMVLAVRMARAAMEPDSAERQAGWEGPGLKDITEFWRLERLKRRGIIEADEPEDDSYTAMAMKMWWQPFLPNLMNSVVWLVETAQTVAILFVNYKGQPWMKGVMENRALFLSVFIVAGGVAAAAWEFVPELNELIHLSPFPNDQFRFGVMALVATTLVGTFIWDRICVAFFAPDIFKAMVISAKSTTFTGDILPIFKTVGKVAAVFLVLGTGNILLAGGAFWMYKRSTKEPE